MKPYFENEKFTVYHGDSSDVLASLDLSFDSCVTDPPYGLSFMGKKWDYDVPTVELWQRILERMKPGAHLLSFAGTRTQHRMCCRIEDAGFEIRDMIAWVYGSGFPKSHNGPWGGTALKPAMEPITLARKPLTGTVAQNYLEHGVGGLNIDACRVETVDAIKFAPTRKRINGILGKDGDMRQPYEQNSLGRWPANLIHDGSGDVVSLFPANRPGMSGGGKHKAGAAGGMFGAIDCEHTARGDNGSAARFFYCAKASKKDRDDGLSDMPEASAGERTGRVDGSDGITAYAGSRTQMRNVHPTVKPTDLMRYLCRLVTPPGGLILDPFLGSGSTGRGAILEGFRFVGIEREEQYCEIAVKRILAAMERADD